MNKNQSKRANQRNAPKQRNTSSKPNPNKGVNKLLQSKFDPTRDAWLATLVDPWGVHGVRIPDQITTPSCTASLRYRTTLRPLQDGSTGNYAIAFTFIPTVHNGLATSNAYNSTTGVITLGPFFDFTGYGTFSNLSRDYRVVSAGLAVYSTTAMAQNRGRNLCAFYQGTDHLQVPDLTTVSAGDQLNAENSEDSPLNKEMVCSITWRPSDVSSYEYHANASTAGGTPETGTFYNPGQLVWFADGLDSSASFEVSAVLNVEYVPNQNSISFLLTLPSRYDVQAMQRALNSSVIARIFGSATPESVMITSPSNNLGLTTAMGSFISSFGSGAKDALSRFADEIGRSLASRSLRTLVRQSNSMPVYSSLLGLNN